MIRGVFLVKAFLISNGMDFLSKYKITPLKVVKSVLIGIGVLIAFVLITKLASVQFGGARFGLGVAKQDISSVSPSYGSGMYDVLSLKDFRLGM